MVKHEKFRPGPGIKIFDEIFDQIFEYSSKTDKWTYHPKNIKKDHLSLLLAWPGIFTFEFAEITGDKALAKKIRKLHKLLKDTTVKEQGSDIEKQVTDLIQEVLSRVYFLTLPDSLHIDPKLIRTLTFLISQYLIICSILIDVFANDESSENRIFISNDKVVKLITEYRIKNNIVHHFHLISLWWLFQSLDFADAYVHKFYTNSKNFFYKNSTEFPRDNLVLDNYVNENRNEIGIILKKDCSQLNKNEQFGLAIDLNTSYNLKDYISVFLVCFDQPFENEEQIMNGFFFVKRFDIGDDLCEELFRYMNILAKQISHNANEIIESLENFINSPAEFILPNLNNNKFSNYIDRLNKSHRSVQVLKDFSELKRSILSCDEDFDRIFPEYTRKRNSLIKCLQKTIGFERSAQLLEAAIEIDNYRKLVSVNYKELEKKRRRNGPNLEEYAAAEYITYIGETKYLKLLKKDDLLRIIIRGDKNAKRDSYRNVLPIIKWYLEGAVEGIDKMSGSTLTKAIGLE